MNNKTYYEVGVRKNYKAAKHNPITGSRLLRDYDLLILSILHTRNLNVIYWGEKYD